MAEDGARLHPALNTSFQSVHLLRWANFWEHLAFLPSCRFYKFQADNNLLVLCRKYGLLLHPLVVGVGVEVVVEDVLVLPVLKFVLERPLSSPRIFES